MSKKSNQGYLNDRETVGVGYPEYYANIVYRIFTLKTKQISKPRSQQID
jgi:hypothetical protein